jgi:hypothetical protein
MSDKLTVTEGPADPEGLRRMACYRRNHEWFGKHAESLFEQYRGRYVAVSEGEIFVADDHWEAQRLALVKHPEDVPYIELVPREKRIWIYAC